MTSFYTPARPAVHAKNVDSLDHWQPIGPLARRIVRDLRLPLPTVIAALEAHGIRVEGE